MWRPRWPVACGGWLRVCEGRGCASLCGYLGGAWRGARVLPPPCGLGSFIGRQDSCSEQGSELASRIFPTLQNKESNIHACMHEACISNSHARAALHVRTSSCGNGYMDIYTCMHGIHGYPFIHTCFVSLLCCPIGYMDILMYWIHMQYYHSYIHGMYRRNEVHDWPSDSVATRGQVFVV